MSGEPIGVASARERNARDADAVVAVERIGGDLMVTVGQVPIREYGDLGRPFEKAQIRLTPADLDELIETLSTARAAL